MKELENKKVAVVHDWIFCRRGGEKVLERILNLIPQADLFFLFGNPEKHLKLQNKHRFIPSFLSRIPFISKIYKAFLPFFPVAIESFDLSHYDLVISTSSCVAKGIIPPVLGKHICYIHSPMRYAWDQEHRYFKKMPSLFRPIEVLRRMMLSKLRVWDVTSSVRIDTLISNSTFVARRCELYYGKKSTVIYPPVDIHSFALSSCTNILTDCDSSVKKVLLFGAWVPYKKMYETLELLVQNNIPVIAAGHGKDIEKAYKKFSKQVEFFLNPKDTEIAEIYSRSHVLLFPAIEDFGIVPLEATSCGIWVVAPNQGGTKETVINKVTGFTFQEGNALEMISSVKKALNLDRTQDDLKNMKFHVEKFSCNEFDRKIKDIILENI